MSKYVLLDEMHLSIRAPADLEEATCEAIQRNLDSRSFQAALRRAVRQFIHQYPDLDSIRLSISR